MKFAKKIISFLFIFLTLTTLLCRLSVTADAAFTNDIDTLSEGIILINLDTDTVVYEKNADTRLEPASMTKVMLAGIFLDAVGDQLNTLTLTVPAYCLDELFGTNSSLGGLQRGEIVTAYQLLCFLLIPSGNDAAMVIADYLGNGDVLAGVALMNEKAEELGCTNTHFANPHGLHDPEHYTSARDMVTITRWAMEKEHFMEICKKTSYTVPATNIIDHSRVLNTTNLMMLSYSSYYSPYVQGIKTGSTTESGYSLVSSAYSSKLDYRYLCVAMDAPLYDADGNKAAVNGAMTDTKALYDWAFSSLEMKQLITATEPFTSIKINRSWSVDSVLIYPEKDVATVVPKEISAENILIVPDENFPSSLSAPVKKGDIVSQAKIMYADMTLGTVNLVLGESVNESILLHVFHLIHTVINSSAFRIIFILLLLLILCYILLTVFYNKKKGKRKPSLQIRKF